MKKNKERDDKNNIINDYKKLEKNSEKMKTRDAKIHILRIALLISLLFLIIIYFLLKVWYAKGGFTIGLDRDLSKKSGIILTEAKDGTDYKIQLDAGDIDYIDNISINWLPSNIDNEKDGSHNGDNYLAYTFYIHNMGSDAVNYWYTIYIDDVIKNLDKAIRIMVFHNGEKVVYAKKSSSGNNENGTEQFFSDAIVTLKQVKDFQSSQVDKFTIVIWVEGDDPECLDDLIGGEMKMHMEITQEQINNSEE